jgi:hypothetical protein
VGSTGQRHPGTALLREQRNSSFIRTRTGRSRPTIRAGSARGSCRRRFCSAADRSGCTKSSLRGIRCPAVEANIPVEGQSGAGRDRDSQLQAVTRTGGAAAGTSRTSCPASSRTRPHDTRHTRRKPKRSRWHSAPTGARTSRTCDGSSHPAPAHRPGRRDRRIRVQFRRQLRCVQRTGLNEVTNIIDSRDHCWREPVEMTPAQQDRWDRSHADYGLAIAPAGRAATRLTIMRRWRDEGALSVSLGRPGRLCRRFSPRPARRRHA